MLNFLGILLQDKYIHKPNLHNIHTDEGPDLAKEEILSAIKTMKNKKAVGRDELPAEILR